MLILYAAGNDGLKEGSVSGTVGSPATAKNIISVGASQTTNQGWIDSTDYIDYEEKRLDAAEQLGQDVSTFDCCTYTQNPKVPAYCCQAYIKQQIQNSPTEHYEGSAK
jgi:ABC-type antimicrobial peptide transport system ATPase subunit